MIEVRQVHEDELDAMLTCMTTAFGVPKESWADGFYNGPYNDLKWKRVVVVEGKVVSCLVFIPARVFLGGTTVSMGGIAGVATLPEERRHGYAGMLLTDSVRVLREQGFATSALYPFSFRYYRKFGWEFASQVLTFSAKPELLPRYGESSRVRPFDEGDLSALMRLYESYYSSRVGPFVRDEMHWKRHILPRAEKVLVYDCDGIQGYLLATQSEEDSETHYRVYEIVVASEEARRGLVGFLAGTAGEASRVTITSSEYDLRALGLLSPRAHWEEGYDPRAEIRIVPQFQFRIIDLEEALKALSRRITSFSGELTIKVRDEIGDWNEQPVTITAPGEVRHVSGPNWVAGDVRTISQIFVGFLSAPDAFSLGRIEISGAEALDLAQHVFPECEPFIPHLDEF